MTAAYNGIAFDQFFLGGGWRGQVPFITGIKDPREFESFPLKTRLSCVQVPNKTGFTAFRNV